MEFPYWRRNLIFLAFGCFVAQIAFSIVVAFLPQYLVSLGLRENQGFWSGVAISVSSLTYAVVAPLWGSLADRVGKRAMLVRSGLGIAVCYLITGLVNNHLHVVLLRGLMGLVSGYIPSATILAATNTPEAHLAGALGVLQTAVAIGTIAGPLVGGVVAEWVGFRGVFVVAAGLIFSATVLPVALVREQVVKGGAPAGMRSELRTAWANPALRRLFVALFLAQAAVQIVQPTLPLWIGQLVPERVALITGLIYSLMGISMALGAAFVGRWANHWGGQALLQTAFGLAAALFVLQGLARTIWTLAGFRFLAGFAVVGVTVAGNLLVAQAAPPEGRGMAFGVLNSMTAMGGVAGPLLGGFVGDHYGLTSPFFGGALLYAIAAAGLLTGVSRPRLRRLGY